MAYNENLTNRVRQALKDAPNVEEKKMFRGMTFMVDGKMCISVGDDEIMCRIDPALHEASVAKQGCRTVEMRGRGYRGYVYVKEEGITAAKDLEYWVALALDFNKRAKATKKKDKI
jgi:TfoX/Sxy family transcriptional regulator of competence genes